MSYIQFKEISKQFGDKIACKNISLNIEKGSVHSVIGENGAGKSTLMKLLGGIEPVTTGQIFLENKLYEPHSAQDAFKNKIAFIHQHFVLADHLTALDNIVLSSSANLHPLKNQPRHKIRLEAESLIKKFNWSVNLDSLVENISVGEQQRLEILKALMQQPEIIIFDEPTAVLTPQESLELLDFILELKKQNKTIILISHKLNEIKKVSDTISVLRRAELIKTSDCNDLTIDQMAEMMIGRKTVKLQSHISEETSQNDITASHAQYLMTLPDSKIAVKKSEIFGVAGVEGNGQNELIANLINEFKKMNLVYGDITEDRLRLSVFEENSLSEHVLLKHHQYFIKNNFVQKDKLQKTTESILQEWDVRPHDPEQKLSELSGGNQQKFIVGREMYGNPSVMIAAHPTRGVDLGAQEKIHQSFIDFVHTHNASASSKTIFLISSDLHEVLNLSDRFVILSKGKAFGPFTKNQLNEIEIGKYMTGAAT